MQKSGIVIAAVGLTGLGLVSFGSQLRHLEATAGLKEERIYLEYTATAGETAVVYQAESEHGLGRVQIKNPEGHVVFDMKAEAGQEVAFSGFVFESLQMNNQEIVELYSPGRYEMLAWTKDGELAVGGAILAHELPRPPVMLYPLDGERDVPPTFTAAWLQDPQAEAYRVTVEQGDSDQLVVELPPSANTFTVPFGVLEPGTLSHVEVAVVGENGNMTLVEVEFTTL